MEINETNNIYSFYYHYYRMRVIFFLQYVVYNSHFIWGYTCHLIIIKRGLISKFGCSNRNTPILVTELWLVWYLTHWLFKNTTLLIHFWIRLSLNSLTSSNFTKLIKDTLFVNVVIFFLINSIAYERENFVGLWKWLTWWVNCITQAYVSC